MKKKIIHKRFISFAFEKPDDYPCVKATQTGAFVRDANY